MKQWESQQRIYEHSEKSAETARHRAQNRVQDSHHRANEMQRLAPVFQTLVSGGGSLNGGGSMNGSWNLAGAVNAFRQAGHATAPPFPMPQPNNFNQNPFQFQQMPTNNNHFQMQPNHMPQSNNHFQAFQMQQNQMPPNNNHFPVQQDSDQNVDFPKWIGHVWCLDPLLRQIKK